MSNSFPPYSKSQHIQDSRQEVHTNVDFVCIYLHWLHNLQDQETQYCMTMKAWRQAMHLYGRASAYQEDNKVLVLKIETAKAEFNNMFENLKQWKEECSKRYDDAESVLIDTQERLIKETPRLKIKCFVVFVRHPSDLFQLEFPTISNFPTRAYHTCPLLFHPFQIQLRR